jgi:hypothetical protein
VLWRPISGNKQVFDHFVFKVKGPGRVRLWRAAFSGPPAAVVATGWKAVVDKSVAPIEPEVHRATIQHHKWWRWRVPRHQSEAAVPTKAKRQLNHGFNEPRRNERKLVEVAGVEPAFSGFSETASTRVVVCLMSLGERETTHFPFASVRFVGASSRTPDENPACQATFRPPQQVSGAERAVIYAAIGRYSSSLIFSVTFLRSKVTTSDVQPCPTVQSRIHDTPFDDFQGFGRRNPWRTRLIQRRIPLSPGRWQWNDT